MPAQARAEERARRPKPAKLAGGWPLRAWVEGKLERNWSPEQVSARLRPEFPDDQEMQVSPETIYQSLYVQGRGRCAGAGRAPADRRALRRPRRRPDERRGRIAGM